MTAKTPTRAKASAEQLAAYGSMLEIRLFEEELQRQFLKGEVHGTVHLYIGQEAVSVGVCSALRATDKVAATYRGHGAALAKGVGVEGLAAELLGRATGTCGGRAGSMNVIDPDVGLIGCFGIVGGSIAAATGAAMSVRREEGVAVAFFGDGATNQAYMHECLNFAQVLRLPVVFVCENNRYGEYTPMEQVTAGDLAGRVAGYGIPTEKVDGNDVEVVREAARQAVDHARSGQGPCFLECATYRHLGHSRSDPGAYRPAEEVEHWKALDPIPRLRERLDAAGFGEDAERVEGVQQARIAAAFEAALAAPYPDPEADEVRIFA